MNKIFVVSLLFVSLILASCNSLTSIGVNSPANSSETKNTIQQDNSKLYQNKIIQTFNGTQKMYYENGNLKAEINLKDGKMHGISKSYHKNGKLQKESIFKNGELNGISKRYHKNGKLHIEENYKNGELDGIKRSYYKSNGALKEEYYIRNGISNVKTYHKTGELKYVFKTKDGKISGIIKEYDKNGKLINKIDPEKLTAKLKGNKTSIINDMNMVSEDDLDGLFVNNKHNIDIFIFFDYNCKYSQKLFKEINEIKNKNKKIRIIYKEHPMLGNLSKELSEIAIAVNIISPENYHKFQYQLITLKNKSAKNAINITKELGLNEKQILSTIKNRKKEIQNKISNNLKLGKYLGITGTPTLIVGSKLIRGAITINELEDEINNAR
jgi:antitoxin component YwqK of YwqJK toxin-antitoxin module